MTELSPITRVVLFVLRVAPFTAEEIAQETKIPGGVVDMALRELVRSGQAREIEPKRFAAG